MATPVGLCPAQLYELTGRKRKSQQIDALVQMAIPYRIRPDGSPFVALTDISMNTPERLEKPERATLATN